jgi:glycosyltransferase involved in cell wall biosynthesis
MDTPVASNIFNFAPSASFKIPRYEHLDIVAPPLLKILRHVDAHRPDVIHVSTPGPVGVVGLIAARMLRVPVMGVYHTDFPAYVDRLFEDPGLTRLCRGFMRLFYSPFGTIFTRSEDYVEALGGLGLERSRARTLAAGVDVDAFHPRFRDPSVWDRVGAGVSPRSVKALYVGRVSVEKNLPMLARVWMAVRRELAARGREAELIIVGDGPYRRPMEESMARAPGGAGVRFLGYRHGEELSAIYASSDFFVFPSTTDTLGQVVLESQASGIPVVVTDKGGPKEVVDDQITGLVLPAADDRAWTEALVRLSADDELRSRLGRTAHVRAQRRSLETSFEQFWQAHADAAKAEASEPRAQARGV